MEFVDCVSKFFRNISPFHSADMPVLLYKLRRKKIIAKFLDGEFHYSKIIIFSFRYFEFFHFLHCLSSQCKCAFNEFFRYSVHSYLNKEIISDRFGWSRIRNKPIYIIKRDFFFNYSISRCFIVVLLFLLLLLLEIQILLFYFHINHIV